MGAQVHVSDRPAEALARRFVALANNLDKGNIAVSGGRTPHELYMLLATVYKSQVPWHRLTLFQVDERPVPPGHEESNWTLLADTILARVSEVRAHRMEAERPLGAEDYERLLRRLVPLNTAGVPVFDLVILGLGADGHTASLFPSTDALEEAERAVVNNEVPALKTSRVTLTFPVLNAAKRRWFLVQGADKAAVFAEAQRGLHPAGRVKDAEWFVDSSVTAAR